jgi:hypothetical protein
MVYNWHPSVIAEYLDKSWVMHHASRGIFYRAEGGISAILGQMPFDSLDQVLYSLSAMRSWAPAQVASVQVAWQRLLDEGLVGLQIGPEMASSCVWSAGLVKSGWSQLGKYAEGQDWLGEDLHSGADFLRDQGDPETDPHDPYSI